LPLGESDCLDWSSDNWKIYCCDRKSRAAFAQRFALWQQATIEIMLAISLTVACSRYIYNGVILHAHPVRGESHNQCNTTAEVATTSPPFHNEPHRSHVLCVKAVNSARPPYPGHSTILLRSEIPSDMCRKLRTEAASNNRDHSRNLSYYCLLALHI